MPQDATTEALVVARWRAAEALRLIAATGRALHPDRATAEDAAAILRQWADQHAAAALRLDAGSLVPRDL